MSNRKLVFRFEVLPCTNTTKSALQQAICTGIGHVGTMCGCGLVPVFYTQPFEDKVLFTMLPAFTHDGLLPSGDYELTFVELRASFLVATPGQAYPNWDSGWRLHLVDNIEVMVKQLWQVGITEIFIDGSFVEDKEHPNDIDGYFECDLMELASGRLQSKLNLLDPSKVWTWDPITRRSYRGYPKKQLPMWHVYRVELYPHYGGQSSGIRDKYGNELEFPSAFRRSRQDGQPRGIVKLKKGDQP